DREALQVPLDVGEPQMDELDALLVHLAQHSLALARRALCPSLLLDHGHALPPLNAKSPGRFSSEATSPTYLFKCSRSRGRFPQAAAVEVDVPNAVRYGCQMSGTFGADSVTKSAGEGGFGGRIRGISHFPTTHMPPFRFQGRR